MNSSTFEIPNNIVPSNSDNNGSTQNISFCKNGLKEIVKEKFHFIFLTTLFEIKSVFYLQNKQNYFPHLRELF